VNGFGGAAGASGAWGSDPPRGDRGAPRHRPRSGRPGQRVAPSGLGGYPGTAKWNSSATILPFFTV
jgi:hypothetical protein